ncbi:MAG: hypothetical protein C7B46_10165 [Sulfobacillus benefaciens]|uniref:Uncharacterized protein n=1 Tax=Sulfobacillus benefaciens TaxID=453960 RepID=A0A2T2XG47_9FIRM|nr:MAG: hypothetical protein C7B46_10165 [Sulfobacillus benefaciens]
MSTGKRILSLLGVAVIAAGAFEAGRLMPQTSPLAAGHTPTSFVIKKTRWSPSNSSSNSNPGNPWITEPPQTITIPNASTAPQSESQNGQSGAVTVDSPSSNWAGVVQLGNSEQSVQASWEAPGFTQAAQPGSSIAEWIGLGGAQSSQLIQIGTITTANNQGSATTTVFWEELPSAAVQTATIPTGSAVTAQIVPDGTDQWRLILSLKGSSTPLIDKLVTLSPQQAQGVESSADWITEVPMGQTGLDSLAPVSSTVMTNVKANGVPLSQMNPQSLQTVGLYGNGGQLLAAPVSDTGSITVDTVYGNLPSSSDQTSGIQGFGGGFGPGSGWYQVQTTFPNSPWGGGGSNYSSSVTFGW